MSIQNLTMLVEKSSTSSLWDPHSTSQSVVLQQPVRAWSVSVNHFLNECYESYRYFSHSWYIVRLEQNRDFPSADSELYVYLTFACIRSIILVLQSTCWDKVGNVLSRVFVQTLPIKPIIKLVMTVYCLVAIIYYNTAFSSSFSSVIIF